MVEEGTTDAQLDAVDFRHDEHEACKLDASCVRIVLIEPRLCQDCGDSYDEGGKLIGRIATHVVYFDLVGNGQDVGIGEYCLFCATEFANRLKASLPPEQPE